MVSKEKRKQYNKRYYMNKKISSLRIQLPDIIEERKDEIVVSPIDPPIIQNPFWLLILKAFEFIKVTFFRY